MNARINKTSLKRILKNAVPSVKFVEVDAFGTKTGDQTIDAYMPFEDADLYDKTAAKLGYRSGNPVCSQIYHAVRRICMWHDLEQTWQDAPVEDFVQMGVLIF